MSVRVIITGDEEVIRMFNTIGTQTMNRVLIPVCNTWAQDIVDEMHKRQHRRSGKMFQRTRVVKRSNGASAVVDVPYADDENRRPGNKMSKGIGQGTSHNFVEPSMRVAEPRNITNLNRQIDAFLRSV